MQLSQLKATIKGLFLALGVAGLVSCGSGDEADGVACGGSDESGVCLSVTTVSPVDTGVGTENFFTVDVFVNGCPTATQTEGIFNHAATITFDAFRTTPGTVATQITVTNYDVTYALLAGDPGPVIPNLINLPTNAVVPIPGAVTQPNFQLLFEDQKVGATALAWVAGDFPNYRVTYTFRGVDDFGNDVDAVGSTQVNIGSYLIEDNCA